MTNALLVIFLKQVVQEYERAVIFRLGRLRSGGAKGPGLFFILPCIDTYRSLDNLKCSQNLYISITRCVDLRTGAFDVPPQEILTRDSVTINVDAVVYYQVNILVPFYPLYNQVNILDNIIKGQ